MSRYAEHGSLTRIYQSTGRAIKFFSFQANLFWWFLQKSLLVTQFVAVQHRRRIQSLMHGIFAKCWFCHITTENLRIWNPCTMLQLIAHNNIMDVMCTSWYSTNFSSPHEVHATLTYSEKNPKSLTTWIFKFDRNSHKTLFAWKPRPTTTVYVNPAISLAFSCFKFGFNSYKTHYSWKPKPTPIVGANPATSWHFSILYWRQERLRVDQSYNLSKLSSGLSARQCEHELALADNNGVVDIVETP